MLCTCRALFKKDFENRSQYGASSRPLPPDATVCHVSLPRVTVCREQIIARIKDGLAVVTFANASDGNAICALTNGVLTPLAGLPFDSADDIVACGDDASAVVLSGGAVYKLSLKMPVSAGGGGGDGGGVGPTATAAKLLDVPAAAVETRVGWEARNDPRFSSLVVATLEDRNLELDPDAPLM